MMHSNNTLSALVIVSGMLLCLGGCDHSDNTSSTGSLSLNLTDAPVDHAESVVVEFSGVEIKPQSGNSITFNFSEDCVLDPDLCQIDLLALNNGISTVLLDDEEVVAGEYNWLRLLVNAEPNVRDSYIVIDGEEFELRIPSGSSSGLKLNHGFVVPAGGTASYTIDFDLRKSVHNPAGKDDYILRPSLRMVDNAETGGLSGNVHPDFFSSGVCSGAVYAFADGTVDAPDDEDGDGFGPDPVTSAMVDDDGVHSYQLSFLEAGDYLIAFTCDAVDDDPEVDDDSATVSFLSTQTVTVVADDNSVYDFLP